MVVVGAPSEPVGDVVATIGGRMAFTNRTCDESGVWAGRCGHEQVVVSKGNRFPECSGCKRGIDWHLVGTVGEALRKNPKATYVESADDGWWPGKASSTVTSYP
jgi:hypothetical protein